MAYGRCNVEHGRWQVAGGQLVVSPQLMVELGWGKSFWNNSIRLSRRSSSLNILLPTEGSCIVKVVTMSLEGRAPPPLHELVTNWGCGAELP